jgi:uncharacterized membrane protein
MQEFLTTYAPILGYVLCIVSLFQLALIFFFERKNIMTDLRGKDRIWQFLELSGIVWLVLFPCTIVSSLFGLHVPTEAWVTLDAVYFMNLGGKMGHKWIDAKTPQQNKNIKKEESTDEGL